MINELQGEKKCFRFSPCLLVYDHENADGPRPLPFVFLYQLGWLQA